METRVPVRRHMKFLERWKCIRQWKTEDCGDRRLRRAPATPPKVLPDRSKIDCSAICMLPLLSYIGPGQLHQRCIPVSFSASMVCLKPNVGGCRQFCRAVMVFSYRGLSQQSMTSGAVQTAHTLREGQIWSCTRLDMVTYDASSKCDVCRLCNRIASLDRE